MRQVAQMVFERGEPGDGLSADLEGRESVGDALLGLGEEVEDRLAQLGQRGALRLFQRIEVPVDLLGRHGPIVLIDEAHQQAVQPARGVSLRTGRLPGAPPAGRTACGSAQGWAIWARRNSVAKARSYAE